MHCNILLVLNRRFQCIGIAGVMMMMIVVISFARGVGGPVRVWYLRNELLLAIMIALQLFGRGKPSIAQSFLTSLSVLGVQSVLGVLGVLGSARPCRFFDNGASGCLLRR